MPFYRDLPESEGAALVPLEVRQLAAEVGRQAAAELGIQTPRMSWFAKCAEFHPKAFRFD